MAVCARWPIVNGEESKLYKELFKYTSRNRKLTNYLYALAIQPELKNEVSPSDYNSQGELNLSKVIELFSVDNLIDVTSTIKNGERELNAIDNSTGEPINYKEVSEIIDKVIDFNNRDNNPVVAKIIRVEDNYNIVVIPKDSENFALNSAYEAGKKQL